MDEQQKQQNTTMAFPDAIMEDTVNLLSILARMRMPRDSSGETNGQSNTPPYSGSNNPATTALGYAAGDGSDQAKEKRSILNQLATQEGLRGIEQESADKEELKRIEKMKLLDSNMREYRIANNGKQPSTQEMVVMMANVGLSVDDIKSIAGSLASHQNS